MLMIVPATKQNDPIRYSQLLMLHLDFWRAPGQVLDRALVELEDDPAHGLVEAHLVEEVELQELALLFGGRRSSPAPDFCRASEYPCALRRATHFSSNGPRPEMRILVGQHVGDAIFEDGRRHVAEADGHAIVAVHQAGRDREVDELLLMSARVGMSSQ